MLNSHVIVQLLALLLAVQSLAYLCLRLLQAQHAVAFSALASGFVSSTATIATLGLVVREGRSPARLMAGAVQPAWLSVLWGPVLAGSVLALAWGWWLVAGGWWLVRRMRHRRQRLPRSQHLQRS